MTDGLHVILILVTGGEQSIVSDLQVLDPAPALSCALHLCRVIKPTNLNLRRIEVIRICCIEAITLALQVVKGYQFLNLVAELLLN